jgi:hypothetical protein
MDFEFYVKTRDFDDSDNVWRIKIDIKLKFGGDEFSDFTVELRLDWLAGVDLQLTS